jgi:hypothetical protein
VDSFQFVQKSNYFDKAITSLSSSDRAKNYLPIFEIYMNEHCTLIHFFLAYICCRSTVSADVRTEGVEPKWTAVDSGEGAKKSEMLQTS